MSEERNDRVDADATGKSRKTATPKRKQKRERGADGEKRKLFAKYVPPTIRRSSRSRTTTTPSSLRYRGRE